MKCFTIVFGFLLGMYANEQNPSMYLGDDFNQISKPEYEKRNIRFASRPNLI